MNVTQRRLIPFVSLLIICLGGGGAARAADTPLPTNLSNEAIWNYMNADGYANWTLLPGTTADHFDPPTSHDTYLTIRVNDIALQYLQANGRFKFQPYKDAAGSNFLQLPEGSLIYKTAANEQGGPMSPGLAVMYKVPQSQLASCAFPLCQNGWLFTFFDTPPEQNNTGPYTQGQSCVACHTGAYSADASDNMLYNQSAKYMLSEADYVWSIFYQMVQDMSTTFIAPP